MIKGRSGASILLGLSRGNIDQLTAGKPILIKGEDLGIGGGLTISIVFGETESAIIRELVAAGFALPPGALEAAERAEREKGFAQVVTMEER